MVLCPLLVHFFNEGKSLPLNPIKNVQFVVADKHPLHLSSTCPLEYVEEQRNLPFFV
jgi:hypothetical protein